MVKVCKAKRLKRCKCGWKTGGSGSQYSSPFRLLERLEGPVFPFIFADCMTIFAAPAHVVLFVALAVAALCEAFVALRALERLHFEVTAHVIDAVRQL